MKPLELTAEELAVIEDALEAYTVTKDNLLDALDAAHYDGIFVNEWDYEQHMRDVDVAEQVLLMIDDVWYLEGFDPSDWRDEDDLFGWDDIEMSYAELADLDLEELIDV